MKVYEALNNAIAEEGTRIVFDVMGDANQNILVDLSQRHHIRLVHARHEQNAVAMAEGYSWFSGGKIGVASCTQGPGLTNAATSLAVARDHKASVLLIAGDCSLGDFYNPQKIDQLAFSTLLANGGALIDAPKTLDVVLDVAFRHLHSGQGPFVINVPQNIQYSDIGDTKWAYQPKYHIIEHGVPDKVAIEQALQILVSAKQPAIIAGRGAVLDKAAGAVGRLADHLGAPIATTLLSKGFCAGHELYVDVSGNLGSGLALEILKYCDCLIAIGTSLNQWTTNFGALAGNKKIIQIDSDEKAFGLFTHVDVALKGNARATTELLLRSLGEAGVKPRGRNDVMLKRIRSWSYPPFNYEDSVDGIDPRRAVQVLERILPPNRILVGDGGHCLMVMCQLMSVNAPENWRFSSGFGAVGQGWGTAIGACFARPGERVTLITGDGSAMFNLADLDTAVRYQLPLTICVLNDNGWGQERHGLKHKSLPESEATVLAPDFVRLANGFGAKGYRMETAEHLDQMEKILSTAQGPVIFDIRINGDIELPVSQEIAHHLS